MTPAFKKKLYSLLLSIADENVPLFGSQRLHNLHSEVKETLKELHEEDKQERIVCAAIWYSEIPLIKPKAAEIARPKNINNGIVICGLRHANCILTKSALTGFTDYEAGHNEQGFITTQNRFVDRKEAAVIALACGQVTELKYFTMSKELDSSDLY
jgi:hypothetical protein